jgi:hypothetical protein
MKTCSGCGAQIFVLGDADADALCRSCRVKSANTAQKKTKPFQNFGATRGRRLLGVRTAGLLFALAVVVTTVVSLRGRTPDSANKAAPAAPAQARERIQLGGHTVEIFVAPPPSSASSGAGK